MIHVELIKEEINEVGSFVKEYTETQRNKYGKEFKSAATMESESAFLWDLENSDEITWKFNKESKIYPGYDIETVRRRKFTGDSVNIEFEDEKIPAVKFLDSFRITYITRLDNRRDNIDYIQTSYYAKGIGLYEYTRVFPDSEVTFTLKEILSLDEWEKSE